MESGGSSEDLSEPGPVIAPGAPKKRLWAIVAAIVVVAVVIIAGVAYVVLQKPLAPVNRVPTLTQTSVSTTVADVGQGVRFTAQGTDPDGDPLTYDWDFGDGSFVSVGSSGTHTFSLPGRYIALVTVKDGKGGEATNDANLIYITVNFPFVNAPTAGNQTGPAVAIVNGDKPATVSNSSVTFNGNSSWAFVWAWNNASNHSEGGSYAQVVAADDATLFNPMAYDWGDGTSTASGTADKVGVVPHTFQKTGNFPVHLTVTASGPSGPVSASSAYSVRVAQAQPAQVVKNPDVITRATFGEPDFLDPAVDYETAGGEISENVYETPIYFEVGSQSITNLIPRLATVVPTIANGGISANGLNYTWTFRTGVKFHNGDAMTAADYVFSIRRVLAIHDPDGPSWMLEQILTNYVSAYAGTGNVSDWVNGEFGITPAAWATVPAHFRAILPAQSQWNTTPLTVPMAQAISDSSVVLVNPTTAVVRLTHPYPGFLSISAFTVSSVVSTRAVMENGGVVWGAHNAWMDRNMIGTGPYRLKAWQPNQVISLERWDQWWRPPPAIRVVNIVKVNDLSTRLFMLLAGDADFGTIGVDHKNDVQNADGTAKSGLKISKDQATINVGFFGYNQNINAAKLPPGDLLKVPVTFFADLQIRKAFSYSFDYASYIQNVLYGAAEQLRGPIPRGLLGFNDTTPLFTKDAAKARAALEAAPSPTPGQSYWQTGFEITLYYNAGNTQREQGCLLLKNGLEALNAQRVGLPAIIVKVTALDWPVYLSTLRGKGLPIFFLGWAPDYADPDDYVFPFIHSRGTFPLRIGYKNATIDAMVSAAGSELDPTKREKMYKDLVTLVVTEHVPYLWISQQTTFTPMRSWVQGYWYNAMHAGIPYYTMSKA